MKHTSGEWEVRGNGIFPKGSSSNIAVVSKKDFTLLPNGIHGKDEEMGANAKLIAAAPDLLNALISIQKAYREAVKLHDPNTHDAVSVIAHNAIAKATQ